MGDFTHPQPGPSKESKDDSDNDSCIIPSQGFYFFDRLQSSHASVNDPLTIESPEHEIMVDLFKSHTQTDEDTARFYLDTSSWKIDVRLFYFILLNL